jgi:LPS-assembly lipoprotein
MSLSSTRSFAVSLVLATAFALSGCTITPVHSDRAITGVSEVQLAYAAPSSRLQQIVYQALAARLGTANPETAPILTASVSTSSSRVGLSTRTEPATDHQVIATISYHVEIQGKLLSSGRRTATSGYRTTGQILADDTARQNADEEAVRAAAQSVIAAILSDPALR